MSDINYDTRLYQVRAMRVYLDKIEKELAKPDRVWESESSHRKNWEKQNAILKYSRKIETLNKILIKSESKYA